MSNKKVLEKVKKLFALSNCKAATKNEVEQALLKAQLLLKNNNLSASDINAEIEIANSEFILDVAKNYANRLMRVISENFQCEFLINYTGKKFAGFQIFGYEKAIVICKQAFIFSYNFIIKNSYNLRAIAVSNCESTKGIERDYAAGFTEGLKSKLNEQSRALLIVTPRETTDFYDDYCSNNGVITTSKKTRFDSASEHFEHGYSDGKSFNFKKELEE